MPQPGQGIPDTARNGQPNFRVNNAAAATAAANNAERVLLDIISYYWKLEKVVNMAANKKTYIKMTRTTMASCTKK